MWNDAMLPPGRLLTEHAAPYVKPPRRPSALRQALFSAELLITFLLGSVGYGALELLWRGRTHWTMLLAGGLCLCILRLLSHSPLPFFTQCVLGSSLITGLELAIGLLCNCHLHWNIWNYAAQRGNLLGQVCPLYSLLWFLLCIPILLVLRAAHRPCSGAQGAKGKEDCT